eukprot:6255692-Prorocentrum_lima.AAC.1
MASSSKSASSPVAHAESLRLVPHPCEAKQMVLHNFITEEMVDMPDKTKLVMKGNWAVLKCPGEDP